MSSAKKIIVSVTTDLYTDQRVDKVCSSLSKKGYAVVLVGRKLKESPPLQIRKYETKRFRLFFNNGPLFYANFNIRLFFYLLFAKADCFFSNDLDSLLANYWVSKMRSIPLVYDSHEYFTEVPELINRKLVKGIWERIERGILPNLKYAFTASSLIAKSYQKKYKTSFRLLRNFPNYEDKGFEQNRQKVILYQGALNKGRGVEELIKAMKFFPDAALWLAGSGDLEEDLKQLAKQLDVEEKVKFLGRLEPNKLQELTRQVSLGVSIEKKMGLNYTYALPNKIFDYIHAGVPVLYSDLEEVIITLGDFEIGQVLVSYEAKILAAQLSEMLSSADQLKWIGNCREAAKIFSWQQEEQQLLSTFDEVFSN